MTTVAAAPGKLHTYKGWTYQQKNRGYWLMTRTADGFTSWHNSFDGCRRYIAKHGKAENPEESFVASH